MKTYSKLALSFVLLSITSCINFSFGQAAMVRVTYEPDSEGFSQLIILAIGLLIFALLFLIYRKIKKKK